jgi:glycine dehydrogenase subunit 1
VVGGVALEPDYPELGNALLVCATEQRTAEEIAAYGEHLQRILERQGMETCRLRPASL